MLEFVIIRYRTYHTYVYISRTNDYMPTMKARRTRI